MDDKKQTLQEQDHPLKNTDNAFVQVGKNGEPLVPNLRDEQNENKEQSKDDAAAYDKP